MKASRIKTAAYFGLRIPAVCAALIIAQICGGKTVFRLETFADHDSYGCEANPTGNPIGGGEGYDDIYETGDFIVTNPDELIEALEKAEPGQVVFVPDGVEINLGEKSTISIPGGVILAGTRGLNGSPGARIFNKSSHFTMFATGGDFARVTGLRFEGQHGGTERKNLSGRFLRISHYNTRVDNCEIYNFSGHDAIGAGRGSSLTYIHHNYMHHIQRGGLGYPICVHGGGDAYIIANKFDYGRHHIAGAGRPGEAYEAAWNLIMENATGTHFDMHGGRDRGDGTDIAGDWLHIHHNTFLDSARRHIGIRGTPSFGADIHNNWFGRPVEDAVASTANTRVFNNVFGPDKTPQEHAVCFSDREQVKCNVIKCMFCDWSSLPPGEHPTEDGLGDPLPEGAVQRLGTLRLRYNSIGGLAYLPDGRAMVASGRDLHVWDMSRGEMLETLRIAESGIRRLEMNSEGSKILILDGGDIAEYSFVEERELHRFPANQPGIGWITYSPDETRVLSSGVTGGNPPTLKEFELATGSELQSIVEKDFAVFRCAAYSADAKSAFVGGGFTTSLAHYDLTTGEKLGEFRIGHSISDIAVSEDGERLLLGCRQYAAEFKINGYKTLQQFTGHHGHQATAVAYARDPGQIFTGSRDGSIRLWDRLENKVLFRWFPHSTRVTQIVVSPEGNRVLSFGGRMVGESNISTGQSTVEWGRHAQGVETVVIMPDGKRAVSGSADNTLRIWDIPSGKTLMVMEGANLGAWSAAVTPCGERIAAGCKDGILREFSADDGSVIRELEGHLGCVRTVAYMPDGKGLISGADDGTVRLWPPNGLQPVRIMKGHLGGVLSLAVSDDGQKILSGGRDGTVRLWNAENGHQLNVFDKHRGWVETVCFGDDDEYVFSAGRNGQILKWNILSGEIKLDMDHGDWVRAIVVAPGSGIICAAGDNNLVTYWNPETGEQIGVFSGHLSSIRDLAITPDGRRLISASADTTLLVWDIPEK